MVSCSISKSVFVMTKQTVDSIFLFKQVASVPNASFIGRRCKVPLKFLCPYILHLLVLSRIQNLINCIFIDDPLTNVGKN